MRMDLDLNMKQKDTFGIIKVKIQVPALKNDEIISLSFVSTKYGLIQIKSYIKNVTGNGTVNKLLKQYGKSKR